MSKIEEEKRDIAHRHDKFFRAALDYLPVAKELIETSLLPELRSQVDFDSLKQEKDSFISKNLKKSICDVLFSAKMRDGKECLFLLIEAQVKPDRWMSMRLIKYMLSICSRYLKNNKKATKLPLVWPLVIYQGTQDYNVVCNFWELFTSPELAKKLWTEDHLVINVHKVDDEELLKQTWSGSLKWMLKHIFDKDLIKSWEKMKEIIPKLAAAGDTGLEYLELMLFYSLTAIEKNDKIRLEKLLKSSLDKEDEAEVMGSLAQHWFDEGRAEGRAEGIEKGIEKGIENGVAQGIEKEKKRTAINMLKKNIDIKFISEVTGLSMIKVRRLQSKI